MYVTALAGCPTGSVMIASTRPSQMTLRQLRVARGWSRHDIADRLQVTYRTVGRWETGQHQPLPRQWQRLADLFGVGVGELVFGHDEERG